MDVESAFARASSIAAPGTAAENDRETLAGDFDSFLTLLTTQLENQDPLSPMDANQFTQQLVQFSSVEQAIEQNSKLDQLIEATQTSNAATALDFLGKTVEVQGSTIDLAGGDADPLSYRLGDAASEVQILVKNDRGATVDRIPGALEPGEHRFAWDGEFATGGPAPDGRYSVVIDARDANGDPVAVETTRRGVVDGVSMVDGAPRLSVDGVDAAIDAVRVLAAA